MVAESFGAKASDLVNQFRILIDDVAETRFSNIQITSLLNVAELDVINDLRVVGWDFQLRKTENVTILSGTQEIALLLNMSGYSPYNIRRNETNNTELVPLVSKYAALESVYPACYFTSPEGTGGTTGHTLGYYKKVSSNMKFTVEYLINFIGEYDKSTYSSSDTATMVPSCYSNLLLYKALGLASSADGGNKLEVFDVRYERNIAVAKQIVGPRLRQVVDVYGD